jgi:hypothetical protein
MAARLNPRNTESVVACIKAKQLLEKLQNHVLDEPNMEKSQVTACTWMLERILARAEAPRQLNVNLSLSELIKQSVNARSE